MKKYFLGKKQKSWSKTVSEAFLLGERDAVQPLKDDSREITTVLRGARLGIHDGLGKRRRR